MIQRFNFYDVYGYLIPGLVFISLLWWPYAVVSGTWPDAKLGSVGAVLIAAYIVGHVIQNLGANAISSKIARDNEKNPSYPSKTLLDDPHMDAEIKRRIRENVRSWFGIDLSSGAGNAAELLKRQGAFVLCRPIVNARTSYAEQYEGLYTMMRGLCVVFGLAAFYLVGWIIAFYHLSCAVAVAECIVGICLIVTLLGSVLRVVPWGSDRRAPIDGIILFTTGVTLISSGCIVAASWTGSLSLYFVLVCYAATVVCVILALRFLALYRYFAIEFARAVWFNFAAEPTNRPSSENRRSGDTNNDGKDEA